MENGGDGGDEVTAHVLDPWQQFARDIVNRRGVLDGSSARLILTGTAGTGKSLVIRSFVNDRRRKAKRGSRNRVCLLAAPTSCASFQMKNGATTVHRAFGVPARKFCGPTGKKGRISNLFLKHN